MTGAYLRVERNGKWENIEVEHLTDDERFIIFSKKEPLVIMQWLDLLCDNVCANEALLDRLVADGIIDKVQK